MHPPSSMWRSPMQTYSNSSNFSASILGEIPVRICSEIMQIPVQFLEDEWIHSFVGKLSSSRIFLRGPACDDETKRIYGKCGWILMQSPPVQWLSAFAGAGGRWRRPRDRFENGPRDTRGWVGWLAGSLAYSNQFNLFPISWSVLLFLKVWNLQLFHGENHGLHVSSGSFSWSFSRLNKKKRPTINICSLVKSNYLGLILIV